MHTDLWLAIEAMLIPSLRAGACLGFFLSAAGLVEGVVAERMVFEEAKGLRKELSG